MYKENATLFQDRWEKPSLYKYHMAAQLYMNRLIIRRIKDKQIKEHALHDMSEAILIMLRLCAATGNREYYDYMIKNFRHKKMRELMLSTARFIFRDYKLFCESIMILYFPNAFYRTRRGCSVAEKIFRYCTLTIRAQDYELYICITKAFHHRRIRLMMLKYSLSNPAVLFKVIMLLYLPKFYYWSRTKLWK